MKPLIGILDSGIGGVTVLKEILKLVPNCDYIYYSDSVNNPYGEKDNDTIIKYVDCIVKNLIDRGCKIIIMACNTATAVTINIMREKYKDIDFIGIEPAYKMVHDYNMDKKTLVMATPATLGSERFMNLYNNYDNNNTLLLACPHLATLIENNDVDGIRKYLTEILPTDQNIEVVVLGCTHYPLIKKEITNILGNVIFYDGGEGVAKRLRTILDDKYVLNDSDSGFITFLDSSNSNMKEKRFYEMLNN